MTATALEIKDDILLLLSRERNPANLERIRAFIATLAFDEEREESEDWWDDLPEAQQQRLLSILEEVRRGDNLIPDDEVWNSLKRWAS